MSLSVEESCEAGTKTPGLPGLPHFAPKAKRAIYLFVNGGPSQMDMWDYKPKMNALFDGLHAGAEHGAKRGHAIERVHQRHLGRARIGEAHFDPCGRSRLQHRFRTRHRPLLSRQARRRAYSC